MKPIDYSKTSRYGETMARGRAQQASGLSPLKNRGMPELEAQLYAQGMDHSLKLADLNLQKHMFDTGLEEKKRQFDESQYETKRQLGQVMDLRSDEFKYQRRQNNKAELLGMVNVGIGLGMGYLQYKQNRRQIELNKIMVGIFKSHKNQGNA